MPTAVNRDLDPLPGADDNGVAPAAYDTNTGTGGDPSGSGNRRGVNPEADPALVTFIDNGVADPLRPPAVPAAVGVATDGDDIGSGDDMHSEDGTTDWEECTPPDGHIGRTGAPALPAKTP